MYDVPLRAIVLDLCNCRVLSEQNGLPAVVRYFQQHGGGFLHYFTYEPHPDPCAMAEENGDVRAVALSLQHPSLQPDVYVLHGITTKGLDPATPGWGSFTYYAGPVKKTADSTCVKWGGSVGGNTYESGFEHCD